MLALAWAFPSHSAVTTYQAKQTYMSDRFNKHWFLCGWNTISGSPVRGWGVGGGKASVITLCWQRPRTANATDILVLCTETIRKWVCFGSPVPGCSNIRSNNISNTSPSAREAAACAAATEVASCHRWVSVSLSRTDPPSSVWLSLYSHCQYYQGRTTANTFIRYWWSFCRSWLEFSPRTHTWPALVSNLLIFSCKVELILFATSCMYDNCFHVF